MTFVFLATAMATVALAIPFMGRMAIGPSVFDRVVAFNGVGTLLPLLLVLIGEVYERAEMFVDISLALLLLNLYTTLLIARYIRKTRATRQHP